jgi:hypothetical protein
VVAAVDLDELAKAGSAVPRLLDALGTLTSRTPDAVSDHPVAERLRRQQLHERCRVLEEHYDEVGAHLCVRAKKSVLAKLGRELGASLPA